MMNRTSVELTHLLMCEGCCGPPLTSTAEKRSQEEYGSYQLYSSTDGHTNVPRLLIVLGFRLDASGLH